MTDIFGSPRLRIESAREHAADLDAKSRAFFDSGPHVTIIETDADGSHDVHKVRLIKCVPARLGLLCAKAIEDLRSALDQTAYAIGIASNASRPQEIHFPFGRTAADFENSVRSNCKGIHPDIIALFRTFKPYKGGDDLLWALNPLRNVSDHRIIAPMAQEMMRASFDISKAGPGVKFADCVWDSTKNEIAILRVPKGTQLKYKADIAFYIAFGDAEIVGGKPAVGVLRTLANKVEDIVSATESEARRIGLIP